MIRCASLLAEKCHHEPLEAFVAQLPHERVGIRVKILLFTALMLIGVEHVTAGPARMQFGWVSGLPTSDRCVRIAPWAMWENRIPPEVSVSERGKGYMDREPVSSCRRQGAQEVPNVLVFGIIVIASGVQKCMEEFGLFALEWRVNPETIPEGSCYRECRA